MSTRIFSLSICFSAKLLPFVPALVYASFIDEKIVQLATLEVVELSLEAGKDVVRESVPVATKDTQYNPLASAPIHFHRRHPLRPRVTAPPPQL